MPPHIYWHDLHGVKRVPAWVPFKRERDGTLFRWCCRCGVKTPEHNFFKGTGEYAGKIACPECAEILNGGKETPWP